MGALLTRWGRAVAAAGIALAVLSSGASAAPRSCQGSGRTLLENAGARIFSDGTRDYGCLRPAGRIRPLGVTHFTGQTNPGPLSQVTLAGDYAAWIQGDPGGFREIDALNLRTGKHWRAGDTDTHVSIADFVLSPIGAVIWLRYYDAMCNDQSTVIESTSRSTITLDSAHNFSRSCAHGLTDPIKSLGLNAALGNGFATSSSSRSYWLKNGVPRDAGLSGSPGASGAAGAVSAATGTAAPAGSCDGHAGSTELETPSARVFSQHGGHYACLRPSGHVWRLQVLRSDPATQVHAYFTGGLELAEPFVAWGEDAVDGAGGDHQQVQVLDLRTGRHRTAASATSEQAVSAWELNSHGTLVWIWAKTFMTSSVIENTPHGDRQLMRPTAPNDGLGTSRSGRVAYWINYPDLSTPHLHFAEIR